LGLTTRPFCHTSRYISAQVSVMRVSLLQREKRHQLTNPRTVLIRHDLPGNASYVQHVVSLDGHKHNRASLPLPAQHRVVGSDVTGGNQQPAQNTASLIGDPQHESAQGTERIDEAGIYSKAEEALHLDDRLLPAHLLWS
jgi:hypothetical protein